MSPDTLVALGSLGQEDSCFSSFPELLYLLEDRKGEYPRSLLDRLATLPLTERPLLLICLSTLEPHIQILWGMHYIIPYFTRATPEYGAVLAFT